jgi:hypothetical protein
MTSDDGGAAPAAFVGIEWSKAWGVNMHNPETLAVYILNKMETTDFPEPVILFMLDIQGHSALAVVMNNLTKRPALIT